MGEIEEFNTLAFEKKLQQLKDTQESIQSLSSWCLKQRAHHKKIVSSWLNVLKRVKVEQRLVLFYLANDVIQYSKRKNYEFVESWGLNLQKATPLVRDEKVRPKILRIFKIWEQRSVYDEEFLSDLTGLLSAGAVKKTDDDPLDFQPQQLVNKIKQCSVLEADTDLRLKYIHESHLSLSDADELCSSLKDRSNKDDVEKELNEGIACVERYTQALQREIVAREALLALLTSANQYYSTQRGEVKVVAYAYKNFGARVRALKRKLDELIPTLPNGAPSPPQRDEDVPSPGPDEDLDLPIPVENSEEDVSYNIDKTFNTSITADGSLYNLGLSSFLSSDNPLELFNDSALLNSTNKIVLKDSRPSDKQDFNINDFLKSLLPNENNSATSDSHSVASGTISQKSQDTLPGLDLLTPESNGNPPPPTSFYGTMESISIDDEPEPYRPEAPAQWNNTWNLSPALPRGLQDTHNVRDTRDSAESPPHSAQIATLSTPLSVPLYTQHTQDLPPVDVDHRGILPPPPPPPVLPPMLGHIEDVDHRILQALPPPPLVTAPVRHPTGHQDVDHRNLIPLTQMSTPRQINPVGVDQDYRVPPVVPPTDIVESVDMDLSEDEEQHGAYQNQQTTNDHRRASFNNKVLVGGDNGKTNHGDQIHANLIRINSVPNAYNSDQANKTAQLPLPNPFDKMPSELSFNMNMEPKQYMQEPKQLEPKLFRSSFDSSDAVNNDSEFDEDIRNRGIERNPSPPPEYQEYKDLQWQNPPPRPFMNQRFPRNWGPRTNFRPQFWPRNNGPPNRWMGPPRPLQRFW